MDTKIERLKAGCCIYTTRAVARLATGRIGDKITRDEMSNIIGRDCHPRQSGYQNVLSAINIVRREHGIVWHWSRAEMFYKCLDDRERLGLAQTYTQHAHKTVRRSIVVTGTIEKSKLTEQERVQCNLVEIQNSLAATSLSRHLAKRLSGSSPQRLISPDYEQLAKLVQGTRHD